MRIYSKNESNIIKDNRDNNAIEDYCQILYHAMKKKFIILYISICHLMRFCLNSLNPYKNSLNFDACDWFLEDEKIPPFRISCLLKINKLTL